MSWAPILIVLAIALMICTPFLPEIIATIKNFFRKK